MERDVRKVKRRLRSEGWFSLGGQRGKGSHEVFYREGMTIPVPNGKNGELPSGTADSIARDAGWK
jgi:predicted RNA binding protein YcfA (HicA-like mRNA interferase family)